MTSNVADSNLKRALLNLPDEVLSMVLGHMPGGAVERVARTYNKRLTDLCRATPIMRYCIQERKNARNMLSLFGRGAGGTVAPWGLADDVHEYVFENLELDTFGPYSEPPEHFHPCLDYMNLRGDASWMEDMLDEAERAPEPVRNHRDPWHETFDLGRLGKLEARAVALGLQIPPAFLAMMHRGRTRGLPLPRSCYLVVGELFGFTTPSGGAGYIIRFCREAFEANYWHLYLDPQGGHCVLYSPGLWAFDEVDMNAAVAPPLSTDPRERAMGIRVLDRDASARAGMMLSGASFEPWLVEMCMHGWAVREIDLDATDGRQTWENLPTALVEYIVGFCTEEGREALERGVAPPLLS
jgi:hypothetical protein